MGVVEQEVLTLLRSSAKERDLTNEERCGVVVVVVVGVGERVEDLGCLDVVVLASEDVIRDGRDEDGRIIEEEERNHGLSDWRIWVMWYRYAGGIVFTVGTFVALAVDCGFYVCA